MSFVSLKITTEQRSIVSKPNKQQAKNQNTLLNYISINHKERTNDYTNGMPLLHVQRNKMYHICLQ